MSDRDIPALTYDALRAEPVSTVTVVEALSLAQATIERLNRHGSANGTLDVLRAVLAREQGEAGAAARIEDLEGRIQQMGELL